MILRWLPAAVVVALQIAYPLTHGGHRDRLAVTTVSAFALTSVGYAIASRGVRYATLLVVVAGGGGFLAEQIGVHTGLPFGDYAYTGGLGPAVAGVPVVIAGGWLIMSHPAVVVATRVARTARSRIVVAAIALAAWDLFLDPQMTAAGHWRWSHPAPHLPGVATVPLSNYGGWLLVALVLMALLVPGAGDGSRSCDPPVVALWIWVWVSSLLAGVAFLHLAAAGLWCFAGMGLVGVPLLVRLRRR